MPKRIKWLKWTERSLHKATIRELFEGVRLPKTGNRRRGLKDFNWATDVDISKLDITNTDGVSELLRNSLLEVFKYVTVSYSNEEVTAVLSNFELIGDSGFGGFSVPQFFGVAKYSGHAIDLLQALCYATIQWLESINWDVKSSDWAWNTFDPTETVYCRFHKGRRKKAVEQAIKKLWGEKQ